MLVTVAVTLLMRMLVHGWGILARCQGVKRLLARDPLQLLEAGEAREIRNDDDLDPPIRRLVLRRVVGPRRLALSEAGRADALWGHAGLDHRVEDGQRAARGQLPIRPV